VDKHSRMLLAEFTGAGILAFAILSGAEPAIVVGFLVMLLGGVSGGHFNPAVSLAVAAAKRISWTQAFQYIVAQFSGAVVARVVYSFVMDDMSGIEFVSGVSTARMMIAEFLGVGLLAVAVVHAIKQKQSGLQLAVFVGVALYVAGLVGVSVNPAIALAFGTNLSWVTLGVPFVASLVAGKMLAAK
jgi:glycerol uptake facilitator-like aquaporin